MAARVLRAERLEERCLLAAAVAAVRVNQVGYIGSEPKTAVLMASKKETGATFRLVDAGGHTVFTAPVGDSTGRWNGKYKKTYALDFSAVSAPGTYTIAVDGPVPAASPPFRIDAGGNLYPGLLSNALFFYQAQRDGADVLPAVLDRQPSHLADQSALVYETPNYAKGVLQGNLTAVGGPIDVSGGWLDAGDYLKFVETVSFANAVMLLAVRDHGDLVAGGPADFAAEARFGLDWLHRMWDDQTATLYYQVGLGDGNDKIHGDHDQWRLPQADDQLNVQPGDADYYVKYRPAFRAGPAGSPISPNLAGRLAASFALGYQVYRDSDPSYAEKCLLAAEHVYDLAKTANVGQLLTAAQFDYYPEVEWREDMELAAVELYFATAGGNLPPGLPHSDPAFYLNGAANWAEAYAESPNNAADSLNLYDVSGLAHYELFRAIDQAGDPPGLAVTQDGLLTDLRSQLDPAAARGGKDPFAAGYPYGYFDATPHAIGYALEAALYDSLEGGARYKQFAQRQIDWALGENAWGSSFVVGAGSTFPHSLHHQVANLAGALDGTSPILLGAVVNGPNGTKVLKHLETPDGANPAPSDGSDPFAVFTGKKSRYRDFVGAWPSVEPSIDYSALSILLFATWSKKGNAPVEVAGPPVAAAMPDAGGALPAASLLLKSARRRLK